jgi:hypothetical protein
MPVIIFDSSIFSFTINSSYTNPERNKKYYEKNSNILKEKAKNYMEKIKETNPEKLKE